MRVRSSLESVINVNRAAALLANRVTSWRVEDPAERWRKLGAMPREVFTEISQLLLLAGVTLSALIVIPSSALLRPTGTSLLGRVLIYGIPLWPLVSGLAGTVECKIRQSRESPVVVASALEGNYRLPPRLDLEGNPRLLLWSSVAGLVATIIAAWLLAGVDPLDLAYWA